MPILKIISLFFFIILLAILDVSLFWLPEGISLVFIFIVILLIKRGQGEIIQKNVLGKIIFLSAALAGFFLDIYSIFFPGIFFMTFLILVFFADKFLLSKFNFNKSLSIFVFAFLNNLFFCILSLIFTYLFFVLGIVDFKIILNKFYWLITLQGVVLNSLLVLFFSRILQIINSKFNLEARGQKISSQRRELQ